MPKHKITFPEKVREQWKINPDNILESKYFVFDNPVFKFSWQPESGELIFAPYPTHHDAMIRSFGSHKFDDYVRGIYFKDKETIYLRGHDREDWILLMKEMLYQYGVPEDYRIIWGQDAALELKEYLKGL